MFVYLIIAVSSWCLYLTYSFWYFSCFTRFRRGCIYLKGKRKTWHKVLRTSKRLKVLVRRWRYVRRYRRRWSITYRKRKVRIRLRRGRVCLRLGRRWRKLRKRRVRGRSWGRRGRRRRGKWRKKKLRRRRRYRRKRRRQRRRRRRRRIRRRRRKVRRRRRRRRQMRRSRIRVYFNGRWNYVIRRRRGYIVRYKRTIYRARWQYFDYFIN